MDTVIFGSAPYKATHSTYSLLDPSPPPFSKSSVHCPPDSPPSTWVQLKKSSFNSCHSTGLAISPAAKAQTGTQQVTLNIRLPPSNHPFTHTPHHNHLPPPPPKTTHTDNCKWTEGERLYFSKIGSADDGVSEGADQAAPLHPF